MIKIEHPETGVEMEVYTPEEVEAQKQEAALAKETEWQEKYKVTESELIQERKFRAEQAQNFKLLKNMTEEEKAKLTVEQIESRKIAEQALEENRTLKEQMEADKKAAVEFKKEQAIKNIVGNDKELRAKLEAELGNVAIEDIEQRVIGAAKLAGIYGGSANPLKGMGHGDAPHQFAPKDDDKAAFFESEKGKAAMDIISKLS